MLWVVAIVSLQEDKVEKDRSASQRSGGKVFLPWKGLLPVTLSVSDIIGLLG